ncbi:MAG: sulfite exporter TauE/SafE family protein, partial [Thaumarchaeota archaeon]|nr:sulfite exporter TauE/SafE family protein [Nitrososphaerota archaeon]
MLDLSYIAIVLIIFLLGVITGGLSNVTSGGAGALTIYVLVAYAKISLQSATGTVLAASTAFVLIGVIAFFRRGQVNKQVGITVGLSGVLGAFLAARWAATVQSSSLEHVFGGFTLVLAVFTAYLFVRDWRKSKAAKINGQVSSVAGSTNKTALQLGMQSANVPRFSGKDPVSLAVQIANGVLIGVVTGLFGVGLASLGVILFIFLFRLDTKIVLGTSLFASFFRYLGGSLG